MGCANGLGKDSIRGDMDGGTFGQPCVSVDSRPFVPPAFLSIGIDPDGNGIEFVTVSGQGSEIDRERGVPAPVPVNEGAVNPYGAVGRNTIKLEFQMFAAIGGIYLEVAAIPTDSTGSISLGNVGFWVERCFRGPVVGEIQFPPVGIIVNRSGCSAGRSCFGIEVGGLVTCNHRKGNVSQMKKPSAIQREFLTGGVGDLSQRSGYGQEKKRSLFHESIKERTL